jgi:two-component system phosphate regulon sensor histidine kinase PhoR
VLSKALARGFDEGRLRSLLTVFFLALAIPTGVLIWQAYSQLKWEAFHQYRGMAEELTRRINANLVDAIETSEARSFADYSFLVVSGDPSANFLQQSALSAYPVPKAVPGLLGYFQVGSNGEFSTPILPERSSPAEQYGISNAEYKQRRALASDLHAVLSNNKLVEHRVAAADIATPPVATVREAVAGAATPKQARSGGVSPPGRLATNKTSPQDTGKSEDQLSATETTFADFTDEQEAISSSSQTPTSQQAFDKLKEPRPSAYFESAESDDRDVAFTAVQESRERDYSLGRVADLKLDSAYQKKSADLELAQQEQKNAPAPSQNAARLTRREQTSQAEHASKVARKREDHPVDGEDLRISTFESEIDPLEFSLLDSGHFVLFRSVWREGERFIQGMLLAQRGFIDGAIDIPFQNAALSAMSVLIVAYQDDVLSTASGGQNASYTSKSGELDGALLYRDRLAAPFGSLEVIYTIKQLPPGPGARILAWVSLVLGLVLTSGFYGLYRMSLRQIRFARQQQNFVSAVSHELKTPLTSIRMYGEMLKEGWAGEEKKQQYYEFIYDESERLTRLISNVLQLANISHNEPQLEMKPIVVAEIMAGIESKISTQVQRAQFELAFLRDRESDSAVVNIDSDRFTQIIINLVDNAIKFSRGADQKRIEIGARLTRDERVVFSVRDFGPGIAKSQMRKIFDMFYRSESELTRETVGTGIGLAIVHQLCAAMGAGVDVLNRDPGAEFQVSVPVSRRQAV